MPVVDTGPKSRECICVCTCENEVQVRISSLLRGQTQSCGCLMRETSAQRIPLLKQTVKKLEADLERVSRIRDRLLKAAKDVVKNWLKNEHVSEPLAQAIEELAAVIYAASIKEESPDAKIQTDA